MSRELIEFSNLIDEQFEPDNAATKELQVAIQNWFAPQFTKAGHIKAAGTSGNWPKGNQIEA